MDNVEVVRAADVEAVYVAVADDDSPELPSTELVLPHPPHAEPVTVLVEVEVVVMVVNWPAAERPSSEQVEDGLLMLVNGLHPTQGPPGV